MAIDHCPAADARVAADLTVIHNPHVVEYLRVAIGQSVVTDLRRAKDFCIVEDHAVFEDPSVLKNLSVAENLSPVAHARVAVNAPTTEDLRVI